MSEVKPFNENIEPIEKLDADELQHGLDLIETTISELYEASNPRGKHYIVVRERVESIIDRLVLSVKKSLALLDGSDRSLLIDEYGDARNYRDTMKHKYPQFEGGQALARLYLLKDLFQLNMRRESLLKEFPETRHAIINYKVSVQKYADKRIRKQELKDAGKHPKKLEGIRAAIRHALKALEDTFPNVLSGVIHKTEKADAVWITLTQEYCNGGKKRVKFRKKYIIIYDPKPHHPKKERGGTLYQFENLKGPLHLAKGKSIKFGKRFIENVSEILEEIENNKKGQ
jgi:hypothetical protein